MRTGPSTFEEMRTAVTSLRSRTRMILNSTVQTTGILQQTQSTKPKDPTQLHIKQYKATVSRYSADLFPVHVKQCRDDDDLFYRGFEIKC